MALAATKTKVYVVGDRKRVHGTLAFDSSYPTGGEPLSSSDLGLELELNEVNVQNTSGYAFSYDYTNSKLLAYQGDNDNAGDAPGIQVPDTTNLSALTAVRFSATGKGTAAV